MVTTGGIASSQKGVSILAADHLVQSNYAFVVGLQSQSFIAVRMQNPDDSSYLVGPPKPSRALPESVIRRDLSNSGNVLANGLTGEVTSSSAKLQTLSKSVVRV